jgi:hypothetical protein
MTRLRRDMMLLAFGGALVGLACGLAHVQAEGPPTMQPLWYAGTVADDSGVPLKDNHQVVLRLFAYPTGPDMPVCEVAPESALPFQNGRFRLDASKCVPTIQAQPDLFAELSVDGKAFLPRSKVGAVPYALEAQHALSANNATEATHAMAAASASTAVNATNATTADTATHASGDLKAAIDELTSRLGKLETRIDLKVFAKGGNNGSVTCEAWCADTSQGATGQCVGAHDDFAHVSLTCSQKLATVGALQCFCSAPS